MLATNAPKSQSVPPPIFIIISFLPIPLIARYCVKVTALFKLFIIISYFILKVNNMIRSVNDFIKHKNKNKRIVILSQLVILILFLSSWEILASLNIINEFLLSKPSSIILLFIEYLSNGILFLVNLHLN